MSCRRHFQSAKSLTVRIFERPGGFALEAGCGEHRVIKNGFVELVS